jgi:hypothetical protein
MDLRADGKPVAVERAELEGIQAAISRAAEGMIKARYVVRAVPFDLSVPESVGDGKGGKRKKEAAPKAGDNANRPSRKRKARDADHSVSGALEWCLCFAFVVRRCGVVAEETCRQTRA